MENVGELKINSLRICEKNTNKSFSSFLRRKLSENFNISHLNISFKSNFIPQMSFESIQNIIHPVFSFSQRKFSSKVPLLVFPSIPQNLTVNTKASINLDIVKFHNLKTFLIPSSTLTKLLGSHFPTPRLSFPSNCQKCLQLNLIKKQNMLKLFFILVFHFFLVDESFS